MEQGNISGNRLMLVLLFLVSMVSVVAVIVAAVSLTNSGSGTPNINVNSGPAAAAGGSSGGGSNMPLVINSGGSSGSSSGGQRIFKLAVGHDYAAHEYLDEQGYLRGFTKELIQEVCATGGLDCRIIWDQYTSCWDSEPGQHGFGGPGLFNSWYDACSGWVATVGRVQVFDFSLPFAKADASYFYVLKSNNDFNPDDITGKTFGFIDGWASDEKCVARRTAVKGSLLPDSSIKHYAGVQATVDALKNGEVDALFNSPSTYSIFDELKPVGAEFQCSVQGLSMMTPKDNDFNGYWNAAFQKFRDSGKFSKLCKQAREQHAHAGDLLECVDAP